jgi:hypothetical protein
LYYKSFAAKDVLGGIEQMLCFILDFKKICFVLAVALTNPHSRGTFKLASIHEDDETDKICSGMKP